MPLAVRVDKLEQMMFARLLLRRLDAEMGEIGADTFECLAKALWHLDVWTNVEPLESRTDGRVGEKFQGVQ